MTVVTAAKGGGIFRDQRVQVRRRARRQEGLMVSSRIFFFSLNCVFVCVRLCKREEIECEHMNN